LRPIPGAIAIGVLDINPVAIVANPAAIHVTAISAFLSIPVLDRISGCANMMYAIVKNVVAPARTSVLTLVLLFIN